MSNFTKNTVLLAVSQSAEPSANSWWIYTFAYSSCPDFPMLGVTSEVVVISTNDYKVCERGLPPEQTSLGGEIRVYNKQQLLSGSSVDSWRFDPDATDWGSYPAQSLGATTTAYLAATRSSAIRLISLVGVPPSRVSRTVDQLPVSALSAPPKALQAGTSTTVETNDRRALDAVWRSGVLSLAANDGCTPAGDSAERACARLVSISTASKQVLDDRDLTLGSGTYVFYPALRPDADGNLIVVFGYSSASDYASVGVTLKPAGGSFVTWLPLARGGAPQTSGRWGDYFGAAVDPSDPGAVWVVGQASARVDSVPDGLGWTTTVARVTVGARPPLVSYPSPRVTAIGPNAATVSAILDTQGLDTSYGFEYGPTSAYGSRTPTQSLPTASTAQTVSAQLPGLSAGTTYHFRLVATNAGGTTNGADQTFTTTIPAPAVTYPSPSSTGVSQTVATALAIVDPRGTDTRYFFEWGRTGDYGFTTAVQSIPGGAGAQTVSAPITRLTPGFTYHFRVNATNRGGTTNGADQTFATSRPTGGSTQVRKGKPGKPKKQSKPGKRRKVK